MATLSKQYTFSAGTASSAQVNQDFDDIIAFINTQVVHRDGSKDMTAPLALPASDPTDANQAARKAYVDKRMRFAGGSVRGHQQNEAVGTFEPLVNAESVVVTPDAGGFAVVNFPAAFPRNTLAVTVSNGDAAGAGDTPLLIETQSVGLSGFYVKVTKAGVAFTGLTRVDYIAIGY